MSEQYSRSTRPLTQDEIALASFLLRVADLDLPDVSAYSASDGREYYMIFSEKSREMRKKISAKYVDPRDEKVAFIDLLTSKNGDAFEISIWKPEALSGSILPPDPSIIEFTE